MSVKHNRNAYIDVEAVFDLAKTYEWSIELLVKTISEMMKIDIYIFSRDLQLISDASSRMFHDDLSDLIFKSSTIDLKILQKIREINGSIGPDGMYRAAEKLFLGDGEYIYVVLSAKSEFDYFDSIFNSLKLHITYLLKKRTSSIAIFSSKVSPISAILEGRILNEDEIRSILDYDDEKSLIRIVVVDNIGREHHLKEAEILLKNTFNSVRTTPFGGKLFAFVKIPKSKERLDNLVRTSWRNIGFNRGCDIDSFNKKLASLNVIACASVAFCTVKIIQTVADLTAQSVEIIKKMEIYEENNAIYYEYDYLPFIRYKQLVPPYVASNDKMSLRCLLEPDVVLLIKYDRQNKTDFLNILHVYLQNNRNVNATAEKLFVHRNTIYYKIQQIEEIIKVNLSDSDIASRYLESIRLYVFLTKYMDLDVQDYLY